MASRPRLLAGFGQQILEFPGRGEAGTALTALVEQGAEVDEFLHQIGGDFFLVLDDL